MNNKLAKVGGKIGPSVVYKVLQLFFVMKAKGTPMPVKLTIIGALGYLISPFDLLPDVIPVLGLTDDIAVIGLALKSIDAYVDDDIREKAKSFMLKFFDSETVASL